MGAVTYVRFYPSDWLAGTRGLTAAETGVYITMIAMICERGGPIACDDMARLARLCGTSASAFRGILDALVSAGKLRVEGDTITNDRAEKEIAAARANSKVASEKSNVRWQKNATKSMPDACCGNAAAMLPVTSIELSPLRSDSSTSSLRSDVRHQAAKPHAEKQPELTPRQVLETVLTARTAADVIAHRQRLRKPMTTRAAQEMVKNFNATGDPEGAAALMIEHGWLTVKVEWYRNANGKRSETRPGNGSALGNALREIAGGPLFAPREHAERVSSTGWDDDFSGTTIDHDPGGESA